MSWLPLESNPDVRAQSLQFLMWFICSNNFRHIIARFLLFVAGYEQGEFQELRRPCVETWQNTSQYLL
jgi:hypothetical protein